MGKYLRPIIGFLSAKRFLLSMLVVSAILLVNSLFFQAFWESNDDPHTLMICSGNGLASRPDEHIPYSHVAVGLFLKSLYCTWPALPWYTYYLLSMQFAAYTAICYAFLAKRACKSQLILFAFFYLAFGLHFTNSLQFTTTACLLGLSACMLLLVWLENWSEKAGRMILLASLVLLLLSALLRIQSLELVAILFLATLIAGFFSSRALLRRSRLIFLLVGVCVAAGLLQWTNERYYAKDEWKDFYRVEKSRREFTDYPDRNFADDKLDKTLQSVGWTPNDVSLIRLFFTLDKNVFDADKMQKVAAALPKTVVRARDYIVTARHILGDPVIWPALLFIPALSFLLDRSKFSLRSLTVLLLEIVILAAALVERIPSRVYVPIFAFLFAVVLLYLDEKKLSELPGKLLGQGGKGKILLVATLLFLALTFAGFVDRTCLSPIKERQEGRAALKQALHDLKPSPEALYIVWASSLHYEMLGPYEDLRPYFASFKLLPVSWLAQAPLLLARLKEFHIAEDDFCRSLYSNRRIFLISENDYNDMLAQHILEHYQQKVICKQTFGRSGVLYVYQMYPEIEQPTPGRSN